MQTKLISQTGLKVRTNCRSGYPFFYPKEATPLTGVQSDNNNCIFERDARSWKCAWAGWPQDVWNCAGNNNGKELDRCMATIWGPADLKTYRSKDGKPYNSDLGDKCFNEFFGRHQQGVAIGQNKAEWENCLATFP